jgi:hypothetical protein
MRIESNFLLKMDEYNERKKLCSRVSVVVVGCGKVARRTREREREREEKTTKRSIVIASRRVSCIFIASHANREEQLTKRRRQRALR